MRANFKALRMAPRQRGMSRTSGGIGKKLASEKEIRPSHQEEVFLSARERVQS